MLFFDGGFVGEWKLLWVFSVGSVGGSRNLGNETLFIADHENVKKSALDLLPAKL